MNLLYISYWGANESLTSSTVVPHLRVLNALPNISKIILVTVNREPVKLNLEEFEKVTHVPHYSWRLPVSALRQMTDFLRMPGILRRIIRREKVDRILSKGVLAGALAHLTTRKLDIPYVVDSFEPHCDYMAESDEWSKAGMKYKYMRKWERQQMIDSQRVFTVSENYRRYLIEVESVSESKIDIMPCCCNTEQFSFSLENRVDLRKQLGIESETTGIYLGKFGGYLLR